MTDRRDSTGGYLTGNEDQGLWDADDEDFSPFDQTDEDDQDDSDEPIETVWARAREVDEQIAKTEEAIARASGLTSFEPDDLPLEELETRAFMLEVERDGLDEEMRIRGLPHQEWSPAPAPASPPPSSASGRRSASPAPPSPATVLRPTLTDEEFQHWEWLDEGVDQVEVARRLGISQPAVSRRSCGPGSTRSTSSGSGSRTTGRRSRRRRVVDRGGGDPVINHLPSD